MAARNSLPDLTDRSHERHRSRRLRYWVAPMKYGFPLVAIAILVLVVLWPKLHFLTTEQPKDEIQKIVRSKRMLENKLQHPRMKSLNEKGRAYVLEAITATQSDHGTTELSGKLTRPSGEMELDDGSLLNFTADNGYFSQQGKQLNLSGNVHVTTSKGYDFRTQSASFDFASNIGEGFEPVTGTGPTQERIEAQGFKITGKGDDIQFTGQTRLTLYTK